jgi:hypothetical protein
MTKQQLEELVRHISRKVMREFVSFQDKKELAAKASDPTSSIINDPSIPPVDAMSPALKAKMDQEKRVAARQQMKQKEIELKAEKDKQKFYKSSEDQSKRVIQKGLERDIQNLKGAGLGPSIT